MFLKRQNRANLFLCSIWLVIFCCSVVWAGEANQSVSHRAKVSSTIKETSPTAVIIRPKNEYWIEYSLSATEWDWNVRRPGIYASKCLTGSITSNVDVLIDFNGFEDLNCPGVPNPNLETYYAVSVLPLTLGQVQWLRASNFNNGNLLITANKDNPTPWYLWNKIFVNGSTSAGKYTDAAFITFVMQNVQPWLDLGP